MSVQKSHIYNYNTNSGVKAKHDNSLATVDQIGNLSTLGRSIDPISDNKSNPRANGHSNSLAQLTKNGNQVSYSKIGNSYRNLSRGSSKNVQASGLASNKYQINNLVGPGSKSQLSSYHSNKHL